VASERVGVAISGKSSLHALVRMHEVRQWYPSEQRHKPIYRGPYIRGPTASLCSLAK